MNTENAFAEHTHYFDNIIDLKNNEKDDAFKENVSE